MFENRLMLALDCIAPHSDLVSDAQAELDALGACIVCGVLVDAGRASARWMVVLDCTPGRQRAARNRQRIAAAYGLA